MAEARESRGIFQRGDPVGTTDAGNPANPESDSPNDAGAQCYVTENCTPGGAASARDVDGPGPVWPRLVSPDINLSGYKRAALRFDLLVYDNSASDPWQDYLEYQGYAASDAGRPAAWGASAARRGAGRP